MKQCFSNITSELAQLKHMFSFISADVKLRDWQQR